MLDDGSLAECRQSYRMRGRPEAGSNPDAVIHSPGLILKRWANEWLCPPTMRSILIASQYRNVPNVRTRVVIYIRQNQPPPYLICHTITIEQTNSKMHSNACFHCVKPIGVVYLMCRIRLACRGCAECARGWSLSAIFGHLRTKIKMHTSTCF